MTTQEHNDSPIPTSHTGGDEKDEHAIASLPSSTEPTASTPPPHGPRVRVILTAMIVGVLMLVAGVIWGGSIRSGVGKLADRLGQKETSAGHQYYTCGMHPFVLLRRPGDCPICHMKLTPVDPAKLIGKLTIDPTVMQNIGVRVAPVTVGPVTREIRTVGTVDYNETAVRDVSIKTAGWVEKLYVDYLGKPVEKGQPLLDIYSPELFAVQQEYLLASAGRGRVSGADSIQAAQSEKDLLDSARTRLEYLDITPEQIAELQAAGKPSKTMTLRSPYQGLVIAKEVNAGMKVDSGMKLFRIADLSTVWVMVTLYEYQLPFIQLGQRAQMTLPYVPGQTFEGKVTYIYPYLNEQLRQVKVRVEFDNPNLTLKPGMFVNIQLRSTLAADQPLVPREAVIDTGERQVAFVSLGQGKFEPRVVRTGPEADNGMIVILDGLKPGEMVVTSGQFLLDSESRTREALAKMIQAGMAADQKASAAPAVSKTELSTLPAPAQQAIGAMLDSYFAINAPLANDSADGLAEPARQLAASVDALMAVEIPGNPHFWHTHMEVADIRGRALELAGESNLASARLKLADLSVALSKLLKATGVPPTYAGEVQELHCPMYREGQGGTIWLQRAGEVRNPYMGQQMPGCFDTRTSLPVTAAVQNDKPAATSQAGKD